MEIFLFIMSHVFIAILAFIAGHDTGCDTGYQRAQQDYYDATASDFYDEDFYDELPF